MSVVAGVDVGGTAVNYTLVDGQEKFLVEGLCEHPSLAKQGPEICLQQIADGCEAAGRGERVRRGMPGSAFNPERHREPIVPIGVWLDRLRPLTTAGRRWMMPTRFLSG